MDPSYIINYVLELPAPCIWFQTQTQSPKQTACKW